MSRHVQDALNVQGRESEKVRGGERKGREAGRPCMEADVRGVQRNRRV